jgi:hypothetical protein
MNKYYANLKLNTLIWLCLIIWSTEVFAAVTIPGKLNSMVDTFINMAENNHNIGLPSDKNKITQYWKALTDLGILVDAALYMQIREQSSVELREELLAIAYAHARDPGKVEGLIGEYGSASSIEKLKVAPMPDPPKPIHLTESYRYAWESLLLAPRTVEIRFMQQKRRIDEALAAIGNNHSLPIFVEAFRLSATMDKTGVETRYRLARRMLFRLIRFQSSEGLFSVLECIQIARQNDITGSGGDQIEDDVINMIKKQEPSDIEEWKSILRQIDLRRLDVDQLDFLNKLTDALNDA